MFPTPMLNYFSSHEMLYKTGTYCNGLKVDESLFML